MFGRREEDRKDRRKEELDDLKETVLLLEEEVKRLSEPPFTAGTILELGQKTTRVAVDNGNIVEIGMPNQTELNSVSKDKFKPGTRVIMNGVGAIVGYSEFGGYSGGDVGTVDEIYQGRLRIKIKGEQKIVLSELKGVKVGDEVQVDRFGILAVERFDRKKTCYDLESIPEAPWDRIGGLEDTIKRVRAEVEAPFVHKEVFKRYGRRPVKGVLLYGPPGCGKTMIAKSIAYNLAKMSGNGNTGQFIGISGSAILQKYVGDSEASIRRIYAVGRERAQETKLPTVIFIDEADSVMKVRGSGISTDVYDSIVPQFLSEMDGINGDCNLITVLASNREDILDPAILRDGRVDRRIRVPRPTKDGAEKIFNLYLNGKPFREANMGPAIAAKRIAGKIYDENNVIYNVVSNRGERIGSFGVHNLMSGAMIKGIVDRACGYAIKREIDGGKKGLIMDDLCLAFNEELGEILGFSQALVRDDWEVVFGNKGRQLYGAYQSGYLSLEKVGEGEE